MYSLRDYGDMIADRERFEAYSRAIANAVRPGDAVLEIGCGPGVFALLACRAGARKVYAIDSEEIVNLARDLAAANGFADRIEFFQSDSRRTELPERVNVIVSDIRGALPLFDQTIPVIENARQRFLVHGGVMIPKRDILRAAVIEAEEYYSRLTFPWRDAVSCVDLSSSLSLVLNSFYSAHFKSEQLLTEPQSCCVLDYSRGAATCASAKIRFQAARAGTAHGVCIWFDAQMADGIAFSSGPSDRPNVYGQRFLPWLHPIEVCKGQEIQVGLHADLVGEDYVWRWETEVSARPDGAGCQFQQSTLQGAILSPDSLQRHAADHVPILSEEGQADRWLLQAMDGKASLQEIAQRAADRFPNLFSSWDEAFRRAAQLSGKFSR